jgi:hypothetical protein
MAGWQTAVESSFSLGPAQSAHTFQAMHTKQHMWTSQPYSRNIFEYPTIGIFPTDILTPFRGDRVIGFALIYLSPHNNDNPVLVV